MTSAEATAEVFLTAFKALSRKEQDAVITGLVKNRKLREDLVDIAIATERVKDPSRPLSEVLNKIKNPTRSL